MGTYRVVHGKHTLWEGDSETGEHFDVGPGEEFTIKRLPPALLPFVAKVSGGVAKKTKKVVQDDEENDETPKGAEE